MTAKPVLCAVDVSNPDEDIDTLREAGRMARLNDAQLDVITVLPDMGMSVIGGYFDPSHHDKAVAEAKRLMRDMVEKALGGAETNKNIRHLVATGRAYEEVLKTARAAGSGLIVIGVAKKLEMSDYILGPNAERVVRHARCSVYVVR
ncbi:universal stress protein [Roseovarius spongiae]|uniref:Universal stress protein n=1 Tax=Roseovarius spongiae TaxID=2320272 RepID=A0A3A8B327_9RHOB|nr:universal stress protein [Roseovarius spongiae]RKF14712.1 universal stress protein [Roseovarius spongiae]